MATQTAGNVLVAIKRETTTGVAAASGAGAIQMRITDSPGLTLARGVIQTAERRNDMVKAMGRLGSKSVGGSYNAELTVGGATDSLLEAALRGVWVAAVAITQATMTSITTPTSNTIVAAGGSWITQGVRVGDIVTLTGHSTAGNNNLRLRVTNVTATTITVAGTPLGVDAVADASFTLTILKKLRTPQGNPTRYSYTVDQYDEDIDLTELFLGCRLTGISISMRPNAIATIAYTFMGMDRTLLVTGTSPWFTSPSVTTGLPLVADDSAIRHNGVDVAKFTGMDLNFAIAGSLTPTIGSLVSPDVFDNDITISGSISAIREDFSRLSLFDAETEFELSVLLTEPGTAPQNCLGFYLPRVKFQTAEAPFMGGEGAKVETLNLMVGPHAGSTIIDASAINIFSSAP